MSVKSIIAYLRFLHLRRLCELKLVDMHLGEQGNNAVMKLPWLLRQESSTSI
jgi:hypothetical protein